MSDWDYGQGEQVSAEYDAAMQAGLCPRCAVHRPSLNHTICDVCEKEEEKAEYEDARYDAEDYYAEIERKLEENADHVEFDDKLEREYWNREMEADGRDEI